MQGSSKQILFLPFKDSCFNPHSHHSSFRGLNIPMQRCTILDNTPRNLLFYYSMCIRGINPCSLELQECKHKVLLRNLLTKFLDHLLGFHCFRDTNSLLFGFCDPPLCASGMEFSTDDLQSPSTVYIP